MFVVNVRRTPVTLLLVGLVLASHQAQATKMLHRNAEELAKLAERIFVGVCTFREARIEGELTINEYTTFNEYTFEVVDGVKGIETGDSLVIRQYAFPVGRGQYPDRQWQLGKIPGMPEYLPGNKYLLFLRDDSARGLTSPIGLGQGAFQIVVAKDGSEHAINLFQNSGVFHRMDPNSGNLLMLSDSHKQVISTTTRGPVSLNLLLDVVREVTR